MSLAEVIDINRNYKEFELKENAHPSLIKRTEDVFYVEPRYSSIKIVKDAKFVLFSAPGASGKSTLAEFIAYKTRSLYWNLARIRLGENSLTGTLWDGLLNSEMETFFQALTNGEALFILDAFDEAEIISGQENIKFLLNDLNKYTQAGNNANILLFARTESARFIAKFFEVNHICYNHYEIGFFDEESAKKFVLLKHKRVGAISKTIKDCVEEQFVKIKELLNNNDKLIESFLGYAPVLEALAKALDDQNNTIKLLATLKANPNVTTNIVSTILKDLLTREQEKLNNAFEQWLHSNYPDFKFYGKLYSIDEQCVRLLEYIMNGRFEEESFFEMPALPSEIESEYVEKLKFFLMNHPFLQNSLSKNCDFTGPAFRDYVLARVFADVLYSDLAYSYPLNLILESHFPSQMLFDFYLDFSKDISGKLFPYIYEAFKAKESNESTAYIRIENEDPKEDDKDHVRFILQFKKQGKNSSIEWEARLIDDNPLLVRRLSNTLISLDKEVIIGENVDEARLLNSVIQARRITLQAKEIILEARAPGVIFLESEEDVFSKCDQATKFKILADKVDLIGINFPNIDSFYNLRSYRVDDKNISIGDECKNLRFFIYRILQAMRKHKKDTMAKDIEFIVNRIVGNNKQRMKYCNFMLEKHIIYIDPEEPHLYKLDADKLAEYDLNWVEVGKMDSSKFKRLYDDFCTWSADN